MATLNKATLKANLLAAITSATAPESISPVILGGIVDDIIDSLYDIIDGIPVTGMVIPSDFTSYVNNGDLLQNILSIIMSRVNQLAIAVTGGIQGLLGEFLAMITADTAQAILINEVTISRDTYRSQGLVKFVNDASNGGFDNGNSWLIDRFVIPTTYGAGFTNVVFGGNGITVNLLSNSLSTGGAIRTLKMVLTKNGVQVGSTESNAAAITTGDPTGVKYYFTDFNTGNIALSSISANDVFGIEVYEKSNAGAASTAESITIQMINGFMYNKLVP